MSISNIKINNIPNKSKIKLNKNDYIRIIVKCNLSQQLKIDVFLSKKLFNDIYSKI